MPDLLLDTCAAIWIMRDAPLRKGAADKISAHLAAGGKVHVSLATAWEVGLLNARGRLPLAFSPAEWFRRLMAVPDIKPVPPTEAALIASHFLPGTPPNDPLDRIMIATAREHGLRIVTRDRLILAYAEAGHLTALEC
jgi:PIN domain nuclease of toxin-antitoxin system